MPTLKHKGCSEQIANRGRGVFADRPIGRTMELSGVPWHPYLHPVADVNVVVSVTCVKPAEGAE